MFRALNREPAAEEDLRTLAAGELLALSEFAAGTARVRAWNDLDDMVRVVVELARAGIGPELLPLAERAAACLRQVAHETAPMRASGAELACLRELQAAHDQQRRMASSAELMAASVEAIRRMCRAGDRRQPLAIPPATWTR